MDSRRGSVCGSIIGGERGFVGVRMVVDVWPRLYEDATGSAAVGLKVLDACPCVPCAVAWNSGWGIGLSTGFGNGKRLSVPNQVSNSLFEREGNRHRWSSQLSHSRCVRLGSDCVF